MAESRVGPAQYEISHKLTEMRQDKGVPKIGPVPEVKEEEPPKEGQMLLFPNYDIDKPNKLVFGYHPETTVRPPHVPAKEIFPEQWKFYDAEVDAVRERIVTGGGFAQGLEFAEFKEAEEKRTELRDFLER